MRSLLSLLMAAASAVAQSAVVSNVLDAGPGSLRAALVAANASPAASFLIDIAAGGTTGPIVTTSLLPALTRANVTMRTLTGAGRLVIDARSPTASGGVGLDLAGNQIQVLVPMRVLVDQGNAVMVRGTFSRLDDCEAFGTAGGNGLVVVAGADDLVLGRVLLDGFQQGLQLQNCNRARVADDGVSVAEIRNSFGPGLHITGGSAHSIGAFVCTANDRGILAVGCPDLRLGRAGGLRSAATLNRAHGIELSTCARTSLRNADLLGNGTGSGGFGLVVDGGAGSGVSDVRAEANALGGLQIEGGASNLRIANTSTRGLLGPMDNGINVLDASSVTIVDCAFGPDHRIGALLAASGGSPSNVTFCRCSISGDLTGMALSRCTDTLVCSSTLTGNAGNAIQVVGGTLATAPRRVVVANCTVSGNAGNGVSLNTADTVQIGPGNHIDDNSYGGVKVYTSPGVVVRDVLSIDRNRSSGVWLVDCVGVVVARAALHDNRGAGIYALGCTNADIGPEVIIGDTIGSGVQLENSGGCRILSSRITASTAHGVHVLQVGGVTSTMPHHLQSCLIADHPGLALYYASGPPVICELSTIAGNLRGVNSGSNPLTLDSCIVHGNSLEDLQQTATALTVRNTFHQIPPPAPGSTNTSADPLFVSAAAKDWRLQSSSPAIGYANQAIAIPAGGLDAFSGPRVVGALDSGAFEVGPHAAPTARLLLSTATMLHGGAGLAFQVRYPVTTAGMLSILLLQLGPPGGSFPVFGGVIPLAPTPALMTAANDPNSVGTIAVIDSDGLVAGALLWAGRLPTSLQNQIVSLCAVAFDLTPHIGAVSNVATFTVL
ncbi:MAG TPA: right-handed parallel beta-helix repeat-containing protein [Planctomycetota bacterium]|nr:right-handed parallel beta-helix repeat-containing protein [Planctomycetota bacterium]